MPRSALKLTRPLIRKLQLAGALDLTAKFVYYGADYRFGCGAPVEAPRAPSLIEEFIHSFGEPKDVRLMKILEAAAPQNTVIQIRHSRLLYGESLAGGPTETKLLLRPTTKSRVSCTAESTLLPSS